VGPRAGLDDVEKGKILPLLGLELRSHGSRCAYCVTRLPVYVTSIFKSTNAQNGVGRCRLFFICNINQKLSSRAGPNQVLGTGFSNLIISFANKANTYLCNCVQIHYTFRNN
jgi:hypothetical protein